MRLDPRFLLPAAAAGLLLAIPAGGATADPPATFSCPNGFIGLVPIPLVTNKDHNSNGVLCVKQADTHLVFKDDNCNPNCDQDDFTPAALAGELEESFADEILE
jgi:hypothetical protein